MGHVHALNAFNVVTRIPTDILGIPEDMQDQKEYRVSVNRKYSVDPFTVGSKKKTMPRTVQIYELITLMSLLGGRPDHKTFVTPHLLPRPHLKGSRGHLQPSSGVTINLLFHLSLFTSTSNTPSVWLSSPNSLSFQLQPYLPQGSEFLSDLQTKTKHTPKKPPK